MKRTRKTNAREKLLDAAAAIVIEQGTTRMTLDAVAAKAEVSKGGLLYHFASKDALVQAMIARIVEIAEQNFATALANEPVGKGRHARALLNLMMDNDGPFLSDVKRMAAPLLAAAAGHSDLLNPVRGFFEKVHREMCADGLPAAQAWLILAALDGMKFWRALDLLEPSESEQAGIRSLLEKLIESGEAS
jgi:AcrR family transcriptional regulator